MPVPTLITDLSTTISSNSPAGSDVVTPSTGPDDYMRAQSAFIAQLHSLKATIASPTFTGVPAGPTAGAGTNTTQIATTAFVLANPGAAFASGTRMIFQQTAAPTGWTKDTTAAIDNGSLRTVTGSVVNGGTAAFTTAFTSRTPVGSVAAVTGTVGDTTLTTAQIPNHTHSIPSGSGGGGENFTEFLKGVYYGTGSTSSSATGEGGSHTHGFTGNAPAFTGSAMDFAVKYRDVIIAQKD